MSEERYESILQEIFEAAESGRDLSLSDLVDRHPNHASTVRRAFDAALRYQKASAALSRNQPRRPIVLEALQAGDRLGDFEIEGRLASGGMGTVYRARQLSLGRRQVALKVLASELADARAAARFEREARVLAGLHHPSLAEVYGYGAERGSMFFAMRLVNGPTLRDVLLQMAADPRRSRSDGSRLHALVERIAEVADALALVHAAGLVHRDVKPANIVIEGSGVADGRAVLVDFGLVRAVDSRTLTQSEDSPSTPTYAPPEQLLGNEVDARADVFSLGVTLHDLLSGRVPQGRPRASAGLEPIRELAPEVDHDLAAVVARAVDPVAEWRYPSAAGLRDDLRAWLLGESVSARSLSPIERTRRWMAKHPRRIAQLAGLLLLIVLAGALLAGPVESYREIRFARRAFDRGDIPELSRLVAQWSPIAPVSWFGGADLASAVDELRSSARNPLATIAKLTSENSMASALFAAAEVLGPERARSDPLIVRFFAGCELDPELRAAMREEDVTAWAILAARLFYEGPVVDSAHAAWAEPLRKAVLHAWGRESLPDDARLHLVTALGGCGLTERAWDPMLSWGLAAGRSGEEARLALANAGRAILNAECLGGESWKEGRAFWDAIRPKAEEMRDAEPGEVQFGSSFALREAALAMLLSERRHGEVSGEYVDLIHPSALGDISAQDASRLEHWLPCMAVARHESLMGLLASAERQALVTLVSPTTLGLLTGLLDDEPVLVGRLDAWRSALHGSDAIAAFDRGRERGRRMLRAEPVDTDLDEETLLGFQQTFLTTEVPSYESGTTHLPRRTQTGWWGDVGIDLRRLDQLPGIRVESRWRFEIDRIERSGFAWPVRARGFTLRNDDGPSFLYLHSFGHSEVYFEFEVTRESASYNRVAIVQLQGSGRPYYPYGGRAMVEFKLNGELLRIDRINQQHPVEQLLDLPAKSLQAGRNTLTLRLLEASTSPVRVCDLSVKCVPQNRGPHWYLLLWSRLIAR